VREDEFEREIMRILRVVLALLALVCAASAALKPIETDLHPDGNKAVIVYKSTPQGDLRIERGILNATR
jgi:hypothetical protein